MIRTHIIPCDLPREVSDSLNRESGRIYTQVCVYHWRTYRKKGIWLSGGAAEKINDSFREKNRLHAHTIDAAQQGFQKALVATREARKAGFDAKFPQRQKRFRTTIWKNTGIKRPGRKRVLSNGRGNPVIAINLPESREDALRFLEVRLVFDRRARRYFWHLVVENSQQPKQTRGNHTVSVDLGEVHPAVVGDEKEATILACRELRHQKQGHNKRLAGINRAISRTKKGSRKRKRLYRARTRLRAKHERVVRDMEHKISRAAVSVALERQANVIVLGDVRDAADGVDFRKDSNQKISQWSHGNVRKYVEYKAEAEGIETQLVSERYTSQTGPNCLHRHKPKGRRFRCPACKFQSHRDVVGQVNILSMFRHGEPGKIPIPVSIKHRIPHNLRIMRRRQDTGQIVSVAWRNGQEAAGL